MLNPVLSQQLGTHKCGSRLFDMRHSYDICRSIARSANSSFPMAFRLLPDRGRRAMDALYAFLRLTDDIADEPGEIAAKRLLIAQWRAGLRDALVGRLSHPLHAALCDSMQRYEIPAEYLFAAIDGVEADLEPVRFATFADLYPYCYRVASVVGLSCIRIVGVSGRCAAMRGKPARRVGRHSLPADQYPPATSPRTATEDESTSPAPNWSRSTAPLTAGESKSMSRGFKR